MNSNVKFIINADNDVFQFEDNIKINCLVCDSDEWILKNDELFQFALEKECKNSKDIENEDGYSSLTNIFLNNYDKIVANLKLIG